MLIFRETTWSTETRTCGDLPQLRADLRLLIDRVDRTMRIFADGRARGMLGDPEDVELVNAAEDLMLLAWADMVLALSIAAEVGVTDDLLGKVLDPIHVSLPAALDFLRQHRASSVEVAR